MKMLIYDSKVAYEYFMQSVRTDTEPDQAKVKRNIKAKKLIFDAELYASILAVRLRLLDEIGSMESSRYFARGISGYCTFGDWDVAALVGELCGEFAEFESQALRNMTLLAMNLC